MGSGRKTWANGDVLTAPDINGYLMDQSIIVCTSGTRPASPPDGMLIYETDTKRYVSRNLSTWEIFGNSQKTINTNQTLTASTTNPTLGSGAFNQSWYSFAPGGVVNFSFFIKFGSSGAAPGTGQYLVPLPFSSGNPFASNGQPAMGPMMIRDDSASSIQNGVCYIPPSNLAVLAFSLAAGGAVTNVAPWTWAALDYIAGSITYCL